MANDLSVAKRKPSYGEQRSFRGLEDFAIRRRLKMARKFVDLLRHENPEKELQILELGCGFWERNPQMLSEDFAAVMFTGVDLKVTEEIRKGTIRLIAADITQWNIDQSYDGILSLAVLEHLLASAQHFALIASGLKKGWLGRFNHANSPSPFDFRKSRIGGNFRS